MTGIQRVAAVAAVVLLGVAGGCGGEAAPEGADGSPGAAPTSGGSANEGTGGSDVADPGDDLLARARQSFLFSDTGTEVTWRWPESYETTSKRQATSGDYDLLVGSQEGADQQAAAEGLRTESSGEGSVDEVTVDGRRFTVFTKDTENISLRAFFYSPDEASGTYVVELFAGTSLADTPQQRLDEVHQVLASLGFEAQQS